MTAEGEVHDLGLKLTGSGSIDTRELEAIEASVVLTGSGDVRVHASEVMDGSVTGSGSLHFYGNPEDVYTQVVGSGRIKRR